MVSQAKKLKNAERAITKQERALQRAATKDLRQTVAMQKAADARVTLMRQKAARKQLAAVADTHRAIGARRAAEISGMPQGASYLRCLVNPSETKYCYPDTHVGETAICQYVYNGNLNVNADKEFFASINPVLHHHITQLNKLATRDRKSVV